MQHYRGINLVNAVYMNNQKYKLAVDKLCDRLEKTGYTLIGAYHSTSKRINRRCNNGHDILIKPKEFEAKKAGCKCCCYFNRQSDLNTEFKKIVKCHRLTQQEPFDFRAGVLAGLKERYHFTYPFDQEHWISQYKAVKHVLFSCHCDKCRKGGKSL